MSDKNSSAVAIALALLGLLQTVSLAYVYSIDGRLGRVETVMMDARGGKR